MKQTQNVFFPTYFKGFNVYVRVVDFDIHTNSSEQKVNNRHNGVVVNHDLKRQTGSELMFCVCTRHDVMRECLVVVFYFENVFAIFVAG